LRRGSEREAAFVKRVRPGIVHIQGESSREAFSKSGLKRVVIGYQVIAGHGDIAELAVRPPRRAGNNPVQIVPSIEVDPAISDIPSLRHAVLSDRLLHIQIPLLGVCGRPILWQRRVVGDRRKGSDRWKRKSGQIRLLLARNGGALLEYIIR